MDSPHGTLRPRGRDIVRRERLRRPELHRRAERAAVRRPITFAARSRRAAQSRPSPRPRTGKDQKHRTPGTPDDPPVQRRLPGNAGRRHSRRSPQRARLRPCSGILHLLRLARTRKCQQKHRSAATFERTGVRRRARRRKTGTAHGCGHPDFSAEQGSRMGRFRVQ